MQNKSSGLFSLFNFDCFKNVIILTIITVLYLFSIFFVLVAAVSPLHSTHTMVCNVKIFMFNVHSVMAPHLNDCSFIHVGCSGS